MKIIYKPNAMEEIDEVLDYIDGIIVGLQNLSVSQSLYLDLDKIKELRSKYPKLEIFVSINKNIFNHELELLEKSLKELACIKVNGVLFYDLSIPYLKKKNNLSIELVWNQTHMVTNYNTCNYYYDLGCHYAFLSSEITLDEINEIKNKTKTKLMALAFGRPVISHSKRKLLTNYFKSTSKVKEKDRYNIYDNHNSFDVSEEESGTIFINNSIINGTCLILDSDIDYIVVDNIGDETNTLLNLVRELLINKNKDNIKKIEEIIGNDTNFFFKKTMYVVKKDER